jgi:hypothetical protein
VHLKGASALDQARLERLLAALHVTDDAATVLHRLCLVCVDQVGVDGAALSGVSDGEPRLLDASDPDIAGISSLQFELGEGPCLDALATFHLASHPDLTQADAHRRWPAFTSAVLERRIAAAFAFPLVNAGVAIGTLDMYNRRAGPLDADQTADAHLLADLAALAVDQPEAASSIDEVGIAVEPSAPWAHSAIVHNASGMLAEQLGITVEDALLRLRALAFVQGRSVTQLARAVVSRQLIIESWADRE